MRRRFRGSEVEVCYEITVPVIVTCRVSGGCPEVPRTMNGPGEPAEAPEVEIVAMESESGVTLNGLMDELTKAEVEAIEEKALEAAEDSEIAAREEADERRAEARREAGWERD